MAPPGSMTGGEPSIPPILLSCGEALTARHYISRNSNRDPSLGLSRFLSVSDPSRVSFINAGLHLEERETVGATRHFSARHLL